jgi:23S rRNA-/tRNA-specific pseudouridylate synthase
MLHYICREKKVQKEYLALVIGVPSWQETEVDAAIDLCDDDS